MDFDNSVDTITPDVSSLTITFGGTGSILIPSGTVSNRPGTPVNGMFRWASDAASGGITGSPEIYTGVTFGWKSLQYQSSNLDGLSGLSTTGLVSRTGSGTFSPRSISVNTSRLQISNADGVSGSPTIDFASTVTLAGAINEAPTVTLASASTVNIGAAAANTISISGTASITAFDTVAAGAVRRLIFQGVLTLTYNATSLILPTSASITTAANDAATFLSLGSGNWKCVNYSKADGSALTGGGSFTGGTLTSALNEAPPVTIASAATVNIGAAAANSIIITGNVTISAFDTIAAGAVRHLKFSGNSGLIAILHNSTSLILPTGQMLTLMAGDTATFESLGSGNWVCTSFKRANGRYLIANPYTSGYSYVDCNNASILDEDIASNIPTSGVFNGSGNPAGVLQIAYPNTFSSWTATNVTVTSNSGVAPDGTTTAALVVPNTTASVDHKMSTGSGAVGYATATWYAKANGYTNIGISDGPNNYVYYTLSGAGTISSLGTGWSDATITPLDNGWYRCTASTNNSTWTSIYLFVLASAISSGNTAANTASTPNGTSGAYFWQVQILNGYDCIVGRLYYATDTKVLYKDTCRGNASGWEIVDPTPGTPSIVAQSAEAISANQLVYILGENNVVQSSNFGTTWSFTNGSATTGATVAPDGTTTGNKINTNTTSGQHLATQTVSFTAQGVFSVYAKAAEYSWISFGSGIASQYVHFNLSSGAVSSLGTGWAAATITSLGNGWYRCTATSTASTAWTNVMIYVNNSMPASGATAPITFVGATTSGVYLWGASLTTGTTVEDYQRTTTAVAVAGTVGLADATTEGKYARGYSKYTLLSGEYGTFFLAGNIMTGSSGLIPGNSYYLSTTAGNMVISSAAPSTQGSGQVFQKVGVALSTTTLMFNPETPFTL